MCIGLLAVTVRGVDSVRACVYVWFVHECADSVEI